MARSLALRLRLRLDSAGSVLLSVARMFLGKGFWVQGPIGPDYLIDGVILVRNHLLSTRCGDA